MESSNFNQLSVYNYAKDMIDVVRDQIKDELHNQSIEIKEINRIVNELNLRYDKNCENLKHVIDTINKHQNDIQKLNDNLNTLCLEIRDIKTKTTTLVWVWKVLTSFPAKFTAAVGAASGIIYYILNYFKI